MRSAYSVEGSNRKCKDKSGWFASRQGQAIGTTGGLRRKVSSDVPLAQLSKPHHRTSLPLLPDHDSQPAPDPLIKALPHRGSAHHKKAPLWSAGLRSGQRVQPVKRSHRICPG